MIHRTVRPAGAVSVGPSPRQMIGGAMPLSPGGAGATKGWSPTVANLLVLIVLELAAFAAIRYAFRVLAH